MSIPTINATVYFQSSRGEEGRVFGRPRLWLRRPLFLYAACMGRLTRMLAGTPQHCAIAYGGMVFDVSAVSVVLRSEHEYVLTRKGLVAAYRVPVLREPRGPRWGRAGFWRSLLRVVSRGRTPAGNCVTFTVAFLRECGYDVPDGLWKPVQVKEWLDGQNFGSPHGFADLGAGRATSDAHGDVPEAGDFC